jgi:ribA/ribD-fused uncharacterized protein
MPNKIERFSGNYAFLSNFYQAKNGLSVEHYFQAAKTDDALEAARIMHAATPGRAKQLGGRCDLRSDWEEVKDAVMLTCLRYKFTNVRLRRLLINTGEATLIEGNGWGDTYWGMYNGTGHNMLGILLMQVRRELIIAHGLAVLRVEGP